MKSPGFELIEGEIAVPANGRVAGFSPGGHAR